MLIKVETEVKYKMVLAVCDCCGPQLLNKYIHKPKVTGTNQR